MEFGGSSAASVVVPEPEAVTTLTAPKKHSFGVSYRRLPLPEILVSFLFKVGFDSICVSTWTIA